MIRTCLLIGFLLALATAVSILQQRRARTGPHAQMIRILGEMNTLTGEIEHALHDQDLRHEQANLTNAIRSIENKYGRSKLIVPFTTTNYFQINPDLVKWKANTDEPGDVAVYCEDRLSTSNFFAVNFSGKAVILRKRPEWNALPLEQIINYK